MPRKKKIVYYPRHTDNLKHLLEELGFVAVGMTENGNQIIYMNHAKNDYQKIFLPTGNVISKHMAAKVVSDLRERFQYSDEEILNALRNTPKEDN